MVRKIKKRRKPGRKGQRNAVDTRASNRPIKTPPVMSSSPSKPQLPDRRDQFSISLCMIVKNESRLIAECLRRARSICRQMVVVDTGSEDNTADLAEAEGAEVYHHPWPGHFSAARNLSLEYAKEEWILILDGDELLEPESLAALTQADLTGLAQAAVEFEIVNFLSDEAQPSNAHFQKQIRLFRRRANHRYEGLIHNQLIDTETGGPLSSVFRRIQVLHYGYTPTVWDAQNKAQRLGMLEKALVENPDSLFCHYNLANHLKILEQFERAVFHYEKCFEGDLGQEWVKIAHFSAAFCANQLGRFERSIEICERLLAREPYVADALLRWAEAQLGLGLPENVVATIAPVISHPSLMAYKQQALEFALPYRLGRAHFELNQHRDALPIFEGLAEFSRDPTVFTHLCLCALHCGQVQLARKAYLRGVELAPDDPDWPGLKSVFDANNIPI
ncbi:MAG: glycosyltransferase [Myxococcota bacterium]|nr:glycosyltransferase [Myxococcota bacterium]